MKHYFKVFLKYIIIVLRFIPKSCEIADVKRGI